MVRPRTIRYPGALTTFVPWELNIGTLDKNKKFLAKNRIFGQKSKLLSKMGTLVQNQNFGQKLEL